MYNPHQHQRKSIRLKGYDYRRAGLYFITICTYGKEHLFGEINETKMILNSYGKIAKNCWIQIPKHFPNTTILEYIIMPNHIHGIIYLNSLTLGTRHAMSLRKNGNIPAKQNGHNISPQNIGLKNHHQYEQFGKPVPGSIPTIIRSYKSAVTKNINQERKSLGAKVWQPRFWEHIIRDKKLYYQIRNYIRNNPLQWHIDKLNT